MLQEMDTSPYRQSQMNSSSMVMNAVMVILDTLVINMTWIWTMRIELTLNKNYVFILIQTKAAALIMKMTMRLTTWMKKKFNPDETRMKKN
jgi:hypothetical protein